MKTAILAKSGAAEFTPEQRLALKTVDPQFISTPLPLSPQDFIREVRDCALVAMTPDAIKKLDRDTLNVLPKLRGLAVLSTGTEWIDAAHVKSLAITLKNLPDYCSTAVVERLLWMMLSFSTKSFELEGKTLGILGLGRIGTKLALKAGTLGLKISHYDPVFKVGSYTAVTFDKILSASDFVALCCPYQGVQLIGARELALMKPSAFLLNTSPQGLVDAWAVSAALEKKTLAGYACDESRGASRVAEAVTRGAQQWVQNIIGLHRQLSKTSGARKGHNPRPSDAAAPDNILSRNSGIGRTW